MSHGLRCDPVRAPLRTIERGPATAPLAFLLHGLPGGAEDWDRLSPLLRQAGFRTMAVDRPGYGGSGADPLPVDAQVEAYARVLRERGGRPALVVGHSYGAIPAAALASRYPELVGALGLLAPALRETRGMPPGTDAVAGLVLRPAVAAFARATLLSSAGRALIANAADPTSFAPDPVDADHLAGVRDRTLQWGAVRSFFLEAKVLSAEASRVEPRLGTLQTPAVVVHARGDRVVEPAAGARTANAIPRCRLHQIDGGHMLTISRADEVARILVDLAAGAGLLSAP